MTEGALALVLTPLTTERTTAATDLLVAAAAGWGGLRLALRGRGRAGLWAASFGCAAFAALLGAAAHGLVLPDPVPSPLWRTINAFLAAAVAFVVSGAAREALGEREARAVFLLSAAGASVFWLLTSFLSSSFSLFVAYEAAGLGVALALLGRLFRRGRPGAGLALSGSILFLAAGAVQASGPFELRAGLPLDHNGLFHLIQLPAFFLLLAGAERLASPSGGPP